MDKYEVVALSPDGAFGYQALHEYLQDGWEVVYSYREPKGMGCWINHVFLRHPSESTEAQQ